MSVLYAIAKPTFSDRPRHEFLPLGSGKGVVIGPPAKVTWVVEECFGYHERNVDAKRAYLTMMQEVFGPSTDDFVKRSFSRDQRLGYVKVVKVVKEK